MTLAGRRLAYGSEISPYLDVDQIKELTGEEDFQARGMGENFSEQRGTCKLEVMMNKQPVIREDPSDGIWRRLRIVPWLVTFEGEQRDNRLFDELKAEAEGILAWLVRGCYRWMDEGLTEPSAIMHATEKFAAEQDHITPFLDEVCDRTDPDALVLAEELFKARQEWNASRNERLNETQKAFGDALKARGLRHGTDDPKTRRTRWKGIQLRDTHWLRSVPLESPGLCTATDEEEAEIRAYRRPVLRVRHRRRRPPPRPSRRHRSERSPCRSHRCASRAGHGGAERAHGHQRSPLTVRSGPAASSTFSTPTPSPSFTNSVKAAFATPAASPPTRSSSVPAGRSRPSTASSSPACSVTPNRSTSRHHGADSGRVVNADGHRVRRCYKRRPHDGHHTFWHPRFTWRMPITLLACSALNYAAR
jgi:hypothetical protein